MIKKKEVLKLSVDEYRNIIIGNTRYRDIKTNIKIKTLCGFRLINDNINQNFKLTD